MATFSNQSQTVPTLLATYRRQTAALDATRDQEEIDRLADESAETLAHLSAQPAQNIGELAEKLGAVLDRLTDFDVVGVRFVQDALADARQLTARAILPTTTPARVPNDKQQFVLPAIPAGSSPALVAAVEQYRTDFVTDVTAERWHAAAKVIHAFSPVSLADLAAQMIVAIHYRDPEIADGALAIEAPEQPADRLAVEMELACLDRLLGTIALPAVTTVDGIEARLDALIAEKAGIDPYADDAGAFEALQERQSALLAEVEALPIAPAHGVLRAKAIAMIHTGDDEPDERPCTDERLAILMRKDWASARDGSSWSADTTPVAQALARFEAAKAAYNASPFAEPGEDDPLEDVFSAAHDTLCTSHCETTGDVAAKFLALWGDGMSPRQETADHLCEDVRRLDREGC